MKLSEHFNSDEFKCHCGKCEQIMPPQELIDVLEDIRTHFGRAVVINSGYRCNDYNTRIGGAEHSQHKLATASDITVAGFTPDEVQEYVLNKYSDKYGIGRYNTFTHIDVRSNKSRWDNRR